MPSPAIALELVPGGYGQAPAGRSASVAARDDRFDLEGAARSEDMSLGFTPRHGAAGAADAGTPGGPRFGLMVREVGGDLERLGVAAGPSGLDPAGREAAGSGLTIGGAMHWHGWTVGGGLGQVEFLGDDVDLVAATIGYGMVSAGIAYGQPTGRDDEAGDVLMLSTDLAAASWLTFESDLALGNRPDVRREDDSVAVGRLGLRLNF